MKYRLLWATALIGVIVQSLLAIREGVFSITDAGSAVVIAGLAITLGEHPRGRHALAP